MVDVSTDPGRLAAVDTEGMGLEPVLSESTPVDLLVSEYNIVAAHPSVLGQVSLATRFGPTSPFDAH